MKPAYDKIGELAGKDEMKKLLDAVEVDWRPSKHGSSSMLMFVIFGAVLLLMLLGVSTAVDHGIRLDRDLPLRGRRPHTPLPRAAAHVRAGLGDHAHVDSVLPSHGES